MIVMDVAGRDAGVLLVFMTMVCMTVALMVMMLMVVVLLAMGMAVPDVAVLRH